MDSMVQRDSHQLEAAAPLLRITPVVCANLQNGHLGSNSNAVGPAALIPGFSLLLRFPLEAMLTFCTIIRKWDRRCHHLIGMLVEFFFNQIFLTLLK